MRTGETEEAEIISAEPYLPLARRIGEVLGHQGSCDCDLILHDGVPTILDLNPRFGGGTPFYIEAGVQLPRYFLDQLTGIDGSLNRPGYRTGVHLRKQFVISEDTDGAGSG